MPPSGTRCTVWSSTYRNTARMHVTVRTQRAFVAARLRWGGPRPFPGGPHTAGVTRSRSRSLLCPLSVPVVEGAGAQAAQLPEAVNTSSHEKRSGLAVSRSPTERPPLPARRCRWIHRERRTTRRRRSSACVSAAGKSAFRHPPPATHHRDGEPSPHGAHHTPLPHQGV